MPNHPSQHPTEAYWHDPDGDTVPVFQRPGEFDRLIALYRERKPKRVLEIGTYYGGTLRQWLKHANKGATVVSVDTYAIPRADNRRHYAAWCPVGVRLLSWQGSSHDPHIIAHVTASGPYDWIFIDADHTLKAVSQDWQVYSKLCAEAGLIALHDILPAPTMPELQVHRLWPKLVKSEARTEELIDDSNASWGGIGIVYR
jgi:predicted O-methyltransferase YrrM